MSPTYEHRAVMYTRCDACDTFRVFDLGPIRGERDMLTAYGRLTSVKTLTCACGATRWDVSIRFGLIQPSAAHDAFVGQSLLATVH